MRRKVVYIAGLGHSGSTVIDLVLSREAKVLSLGEVNFVLAGKQRSEEGTRDVCSCGAQMRECQFWGPFIDRLHRYLGRPYPEKYRMLLSYITETFGSDIAISDSSKKMSVLQKLIADGIAHECDFRVVYTLKDVRSWAVSMKALFFKQHRRFNWYLRHIFFWYRWNRSFRSYIRMSGVSFFQLSYEDFCLGYPGSARLLCEELGIPHAPQEQPLHHVAYGNRMKSQARTFHILYDNRWFKKYWLQLATLLLPWIFFWNLKQVYRLSLKSDR